MRLPRPNSPKFAARAERLSPIEIQEGIDQSLSNAATYWGEYLRSKDQAILNELALTTEALQVLIETLQRRQEEPEHIFRPARQYKRF